MKGHGEKLSRKQEALISALLTAPSLAAAAQQAGLSEVTAWRWLKDATFQAAYREARRAVVQHAIVQLDSSLSVACLTQPPDTVGELSRTVQNPSLF